MPAWETLSAGPPKAPPAGAPLSDGDKKMRQLYPDAPEAVAWGDLKKKPDAPKAEATFQPWKDFKDYVVGGFKAGKDLATNPPAIKSAPASYGAAKAGMPDIPKAATTAPARVAGAMGMAGAPFGAATHAAVSKPLERATGGKVPSEATDLLLSFTPVGVGGALGATGRLAKAVPGGGKALGTVGKAVRESDIVKGVEGTLSPTTVSKEAGKAEGIVREQRGLAERATEQGKAKVDPYYEYLSAMPEKDQLGFIDRVENFSRNVPLADKKAEKAATELRGVYQTVRNDLQNDPNFDQMGFVQDYFPHMWEDPKKAQSFIQGWAGKTGSGRSTQKRSIPTIQDGIAAGLKLRTSNPAETTLQYIGNMYNYKALKGIQSNMTDQGLRKFSPRGSQPAGWVELKGPGNSVMYVDKKGVPHENRAYAPEDAARVYNRYYSPGITGSLKPVANALRGVVNGGTQMVLGLSGFHYRLMANEATAAAFSKGLGRAEKGKLGSAAKAFAGGTPYAGAIRQFKVGKDVEKQYLGGTGNLDNKVIDYLTRAGGRMTGIDKTMKTGGPGNYFKAFQQGTLKASMKADMFKSGVAGPFKAIGKMMDTVNYPLFVKTIPRLKNAVNYEQLADWMKMHPNAGEEEILKASRDIVDSTDNRFGELIQDNIFWDKKFKESLQLIMLSTGWALGTGREVVGGTKDLAKSIMEGKELSPRARYIIGMPLAHMLHASVYQYLKTGQGPQEAQDLVYPKTGGVSPYGGAPERAMVPSQLKDVIGYQKHPGNELYNKLAPVWKTVGEMATNSDWRGDPIYYKFAQNSPGPIKAYLAYLAQAFEPISVKGATQKPEKGSNIGRTERMVAGSRPAGMEKENPQAYQSYTKWSELKREKKGIRHQKVDEQRRRE
jgi:hypothetical protein